MLCVSIGVSVLSWHCAFVHLQYFLFFKQGTWATHTKMWRNLISSVLEAPCCFNVNVSSFLYIAIAESVGHMLVCVPSLTVKGIQVAGSLHCFVFFSPQDQGIKLLKGK